MRSIEPTDVPPNFWTISTGWNLPWYDHAMPVVVVFSTFPSPDKAAEVARTLVEERLAACANLAPGVRSIYRWKGELQDDTETLAIIKTTHERLDALIARLGALHPYDIPEVLALPVTAGSAKYISWVEAETT
jgi:periplasmic divalent cation tolerance protein